MPLTGEQACALYECFLRDTLEIIRSARQQIEFTPIIPYLLEGSEPYFQALTPDFELLLQQSKNLSERLHHTTSHCLQYGDAQAVIMDTNSPTLSYLTRCAVNRGV